MKRKSIVLNAKDLLIKNRKTVESELAVRYMRIMNQPITMTDKKIVAHLKKVKGSTIQNTAKDLMINYKTITDAYRRLEMAGVVKFILKMLPTRDGRKKMETKLFKLTPKFVKVVV